MKYVIYYRVSTNKQGLSGLGLEAQEQQVQTYLQSKSNVEIIGTFTEIESGKKVDRIELNSAVALAKKNRATLLVAKLDRVARNVKLFLELLEQIQIEFTDMPNLNGSTSDSKLILTQLACFSEWEASKVSERTRNALQAKIRRGEKLGIMGKENIKATNGKRKQQADNFAREIAPMLLGLDMSQRAMVEYLNNMNIKSPTGKEWRLNSLQNVLKRVKSFS